MSTRARPYVTWMFMDFRRLVVNCYGMSKITGVMCQDKSDIADAMPSSIEVRRCRLMTSG